MTHPSLYPLSLGYSQGWVCIEICLDPPVANPIGPGWLRACFQKTKVKMPKMAAVAAIFERIRFYFICCELAFEDFCCELAFAILILQMHLFAFPDFSLHISLYALLWHAQMCDQS